MRVLLAEDNIDHRDLIEHNLRRCFPATELIAVNRGEAFLEQLATSVFDVALLDFHLPDMDADTILAQTDQITAATPVVVMSSNDTRDTVVAALRNGGRDFLSKAEAFEHAALGARIEEVIKRRKTEQRLIQAQKDESLALLAGGIAHDFNNMLVGIVGKSALLERSLPADSPQVAYCTSIQRTAQRLADLARQLLAYAHGGKYEPRALDPAVLVHDTIAMLQGVTPPGVQIETQLPSKPGAVRGDHAQLVQCLLNLCLNGCEAMGSHGTLTISVSNVFRDSQWTCHLNMTHHPGAYVELSVTDTGPGVAPDLISRIFDPFFSTKGTSRGLGLAAVQGIVRHHSGSLSLSENPGGGARFTILLPRVGVAAPETREPQARPHVDAMRCIVVEDEPEVAEVVTEILEDEGHAVQTADTVAAAIDALAGAESPDVIVLDMRLPDGSGTEVFEVCQQRHPSVPVVVCSGYERDASLSELLSGQHPTRFLRKPFMPHELLEAMAWASRRRAAQPDALGV